LVYFLPIRMHCFYVGYTEGMTEDGSFIGQYGRKRAQQRLQQIQQEEAAAAAAAAAAQNSPYGGGFATVV
jgi:N-formylglutamate amidohydrolase